ncbi:MAG: 6-phosphofructokinase [Candidatus Competibacteraceae bacterium]
MSHNDKSLGVLTSGGDSQGMNAAVRAVVRTALDRGVSVYAVYEGYQGMVDGGDRIRAMNWNAVGGIMHSGGTVIGTARCPAFREREGRLLAARNLLERGIDRLVIIGGDGSLTGANLFRQEWSGLLEELLAKGDITPEQARAHPYLGIVGLVGSIDNDMFGTDMTIGADSALHRITEAIDAISSTAASHQRTFVVEVMGRNCGYLALMGGLATASDWILIPESPPRMDNWEEAMCDTLERGRKAGRRDSIVVVAEGARDRHGKPIESGYVAQVLKERLKADVRVTILGHVQRGGAPTAFDRYMSTLVGSAAVDEVLSTTPEAEPCVIGLRGNRIRKAPLLECVRKTHEVADAIAAGDYDRAMELRGGSFRESWRTFHTLARSLPYPPKPGQRRLRLAVLHAGAPSPGMNTAVRVAVRIGVDQGHIMLGVHNGFQGLIDNLIQEMDWQSVAGWASRGGAELGTNRQRPETEADFNTIAHNLERNHIEGLLVIGGWSGYEAAYRLWERRKDYPAFDIPMICLPASIDNNLPGSELSIGIDTALNSVVEAVDKIKQSAVASNRVFVIEVMGLYCGYLALMSGMATGAERVYLNEEGVTLRDLQADVESLKAGFADGKRLGLLIRNECANPTYDTPFMCALFTEEGKGLFSVRKAILGHIQQGGDPTPFDRIQASRLASRAIQWLIDKAGQGPTDAVFIGLEKGDIQLHTLQDLPTLGDMQHQRPVEQWWMELRGIARVLAQSGPSQ